MHSWNTIHDCDIAPSPIVPTYRPDPSSKRRYSSMPSPMSSKDAPRPRVASAPRHQARSAGMAERPTRNENLSDLVRFFHQTVPVEPATAPPAANSSAKEPLTKEQVKPFHRRLLQFTQRQKKDAPSAPKSKEDEQRRQIEALRREGYLGNPKPAPSTRSARSKASTDSSLSFSRSRKLDVENIGQPWLEKESRNDGPKLSTDTKRRLASLDLGDFGPMVDVAVSLSTDFDDSSPPPYQPSASSVSRSGQNSASQSTSALPLAKSSIEAQSSRSVTTDPRPASSSADSKDGHTRRRSNSSGYHNAAGASQPALQPVNMQTTESSDSSGKSEPKQDQDAEQRTQAPKSLKLFPDVASSGPASKATRRLSATPRYQTPSSKVHPKTETPEIVEPSSDKERSSENSSSDGPKDEAKPTSSKTFATSTSESATAEKTSQQDTQGQATSRSPSLTMGALKAFPLPAPTRPLPSVPKGHVPSATPEAKLQASSRMIRPGLKASALQLPQPSPIAEDPRELQGRPATALGYAGEQDAAEDHDNLQSRASLERPKSTEPDHQAPRRRASSIRVPRMHDLHESPTEHSSEQAAEGQSVADSSVLSQDVATKTFGKRAARKGLHINPRIDRKHLPFGLPSPPPTAALPSDPPVQPPTDSSAGHRNYTVPTGAPNVRGLDIAFQGGAGAAGISRSNSSRSSLRHEGIAESYEQSRCESPLPSSDDDGFGPSADTKRSRRAIENPSQRTMPTRRGYETLDTRPSHGRLRFPHHTRPQTPQEHSGYGMEKASSPQSQYSQSPYRSRDSQGSYRAQPGSGRAGDFLEDRVANLERQNQILQAALLAALNAGGKGPLEALQSSSVSPTFPAGGLGNPYQSRRPESWVSSSRSSEHSACETPSSLRESQAKVRQFDHMIEDIESGWLSDKPSLSGARMTRNR